MDEPNDGDKLFAGALISKVFFKESHSKWEEIVMTIDVEGTLRLFADETKQTVMKTYDITLWTEESITNNDLPSSSFKSFRISVQLEDDVLRFAFPDDQGREHWLQIIKPFVGMTMTKLMKHIGLQSVNLRDVEVVDDHFVLNTVDGADPIRIQIQKEWRQQNVVDKIKVSIEEVIRFHDNKQGVRCHDDDNCSAMRRIAHCLILWKAMSLWGTPFWAKMQFQEFCDKNYGQQDLLRDYIHFMDHHSNQQSVQEIAGKFQLKCDGVRECKCTSRHFTGRNEHESSNFYVDTLDALHFYICHLEEIGLRIPKEAIQSALDAVDDEEDEHALFGAVVKALSFEVASRRKLLSVERLDGDTNNKFNISTMDKKEEHSDDVALTVTDKMTVFVFRELRNGPFCREIHDLVEREEMDTDCIEDEMAMYQEDGDCNLLQSTEAFDAIRTFMWRHRVSSKALSVGKPLFYWDWHRTVADEEIMKNAHFANINWHGDSIKDLVVSPHYDSIKEEAMASGLVSAANFRENVVEKAARYLQSQKCRALTSSWEMNFRYHFGIKGGSPIRAEYLHSLLLYTDFSEFCTEFRKKSRVTRADETIEDVVKKNSTVYHISKALRELVTLYGTHRAVTVRRDQSKESGSFFCGLSCVLNIPEFSISFQCPTSTTKTKEVAIRFAGETGMMMKLNNIEGDAADEMFFNVSWLSGFAEEDERLFVGSTTHLNVESVTLIRTAKTYSRSLRMFSIFDQVLSGMEVRNWDKISLADWNIIAEAMRVVTGDDAVLQSSKYLDQYIVDNFYLMTLQKGHITLTMHAQYMKDEWIRKLCFADGDDMIRVSLFSLFPNLSTVTINANRKFSVYPFLEALSDTELPESLSTIYINNVDLLSSMMVQMEEERRKRYVSKLDKSEMPLVVHEEKYGGFNRCRGQTYDYILRRVRGVERTRFVKKQKEAMEQERMLLQTLADLLEGRYHLIRQRSKKPNNSVRVLF
jgi:hypothetical protein